MDTYRFVKEPAGRAELVTDQISVTLGRLILGVFLLLAAVGRFLWRITEQRPGREGAPASGRSGKTPKPTGRKGKKW